MRGDAPDPRLRAELARAIRESGFEPGEPFACPYLAGRTARHFTVLPQPLASGVYHALMDLNFRRVGDVFYRPECDACDECRIVRVPVADLALSRAQRRCLAKNADVAVGLGDPEESDEKYVLYRRYLEARHEGPMDGSREEFERFLYVSSIRTVEVTYRIAGRLLAVGIADVEPRAWSAVYCYYDPDEARRSPGVFNVLTLAAESLRCGADWLYLGYYVRGGRQMSYKARFQPCEVLGPDGRFRRLTQSAAAASLTSP